MAKSKGAGSGIRKLDRVLGGGFEKGSLVEVVGGAGTGKSTFGLQFAMQGAGKKEKVLYLSFEEPAESLKKTATTFGWDLEHYRNLVLESIEPFDFNKTFKKITDAMRRHKPDRVVLDTVTSLVLYITKPRWKAAPTHGTNMVYFVPSLADVRRALFELSGELRKSGATALLLCEDGNGFQYSSEALAFICDGIVKLEVAEVGTRVSRTLEIAKMRRIDHPLDMFPMEIGKSGISIRPLEE